MSKELKVFGGILVGTLIAIVAAAFFMTSRQGPTAETIAPVEVLVKSDSWTEGPKDAKVVVTEFADFECPACKAAEPTVQQVRSEYKDKILYVYRYFPLPGHRQAMISAQAAEAAGKQGKFWEMHEALFVNQPNFEVEQLKQYAIDLGLNVDQFMTDLDSDAVRQHVLNDKADGLSLNVNATPTFFINGRRYTGILTFDEFKAAIDAELN